MPFKFVKNIVYNVNCLKLALSIGVFLSAFNSMAQRATPIIKHYGLEDGMSQVSVNDVIKDDNNFIWIGTTDGLNRFDGNIFKHYKNVASDSTSISGNYITKLAKDMNGNLWIGTNGNGLNYYNSVTDSFERVYLNSETSNEIITGIILLNEGALWIATKDNGLYHLQPNDNSYTISSATEEQHITALYQDNSGKIWFGNEIDEVLGLGDSNNKIDIKFQIEGSPRAFYNSGNQLLVGSYEGFFIYNLETKNTQSIELEKTGNFKTMHVVDFLKEDDSHVWIATGRGLYLFDINEQQVLQKIEYSNQFGGLSNNTVQSLYKYSQDLLFVGTANGLNLLEFKGTYFNNISKDKRGSQLLNDNVVFSIYKDENLWIGTSDGGLNLITDKKVYYFIDNNNDLTTISGSVVRAIVHDKINNRMWFGTTRGLSMIDLNSFNPNQPFFYNFYHDPENANSINANFIMDLALDNNKNLWGTTANDGIFRMEYEDIDSYKVSRYNQNINTDNSLINDAANCIEIDSSNSIFIGTQEGLSILSFEESNYSSALFENFKREDSVDKVLSHNAINDILIDNDKNVWVGTRNGLNLFNGTNGFESWTVQNQFPNALIYSLQDDLDGNIWIGTNDGMVSFNKQSETFAHFDVPDNIQGKEFDSHARFRDNEGNIYIGGIDGVTYFNPKDLKFIDEPQELYFSQLRIRDSIVLPQSNGKSILNESIETTSKLVFNYNQFPFYLDYSTKDYRLHKNVQFAYKLLPADTEWNFLKGSEIQFLNLPAGDYNLHVNGFSRGKEWHAEPLNIALTIKPPWWLTQAAIIFYIILIAAFILWLYRFQLAKKLAISESKRLKDVDTLKNSLYTNITHEFRTPITVILGMTETLRTNNKITDLDDTIKPLSMIERNSKSLLKMVNDMLDLTKLESAQMQLNLNQGDVVGFIKYLFESFESLANEKHINYVFYSELDTLVMDFDSDKLATIITNLIINAVKFTPEEGKIIIHLNTIENQDATLLQVKIVDNGIGINKAEIPNVFQKFYQADSTSARRFGGTGVGLALTKELVDLMNGIITVKSEVEKGSEFILQLPVTNNSSIKDFKYDRPEVNFESEEPFDHNVYLELEEQLPIALIIEDNKDVAHYLEMCLKNKYKTLYAQDGEVGIAMAFKYIPDIIISDVMMPKMDGFEVCSKLKSEMATNHIPIILLTAKAADKDRIEGLSYGADAYLIKPFNKEELFTRIDQLIHLRKKMIEKFGKEEYKSFLASKIKNPETVFLKKAVSLINDEIDNPKFGASQLAAKMHLSESQLYRKLKATTDRSTSVFIRSVRLNVAKTLIQTTSKSVSEIAYSVGFNDPSWFSRAFKDEFGKSPSEL